MQRDRFTEEVYTALLGAIHARLKQRVLEAIDADVDAAVEEAVRALKPALNIFEDSYMARTIVNVIVERPERGKELCDG